MISVGTRNTIRFVMLYGMFVLAANSYALKYGIPRGKWSKSFEPPYFDNWSYVHLGSGALGALMGVPPMNYFGLILINEFVFEPLMAHGRSRGLTWIQYANEPDPLNHQIADVVYCELGYMPTYLGIQKAIKKAGSEASDT